MKGQISMEAIIALGMAVVILTSFFNINWERYYTAKDIGEAGETRMTGELLATAINIGYSNGKGFSLYMGSDKINFTELNNNNVQLPLVIDSATRTINITKKVTRSGGGQWNVTVPIIPSNLSRADPTAQYPEITLRNNGTHVIIYANSANIGVQ